MNSIKSASNNHPWGFRIINNSKNKHGNFYVHLGTAVTAFLLLLIHFYKITLPLPEKIGFGGWLDKQTGKRTTNWSIKGAVFSSSATEPYKWD